MKFSTPEIKQKSKVIPMAEFNAYTTFTTMMMKKKKWYTVAKENNPKNKAKNIIVDYMFLY